MIHSTITSSIYPPLLDLTNPNIPDVREVLKKYGNNNPGEAFIKELEERRSKLAQSKVKF